jgi:hypothetical protein
VWIWFIIYKNFASFFSCKNFFLKLFDDLFFNSCYQALSLHVWAAAPYTLQNFFLLFHRLAGGEQPETTHKPVAKLLPAGAGLLALARVMIIYIKKNNLLLKNH